MRNLSVMEQKQIVGGSYYWKLFLEDGEYIKGSLPNTFSRKSTCYNDMEYWGQKLANRYGEDVKGQIYDKDTYEVVDFEWFSPR